MACDQTFLAGQVLLWCCHCSEYPWQAQQSFPSGTKIAARYWDSCTWLPSQRKACGIKTVTVKKL